MDQIIETFKEQIRKNGHLVGVAAGSGMTAKYAVIGGCDMLLALSSGRYRSMGLSSMAGFMSYTNSNDLVMEYACREILRAAGSVPVFFGYNATKAIIAAGRSVRPDIMVICHGGPIAEPDDAAYVIHKIPEIDGFFGASSIERFSAERGIKAQAAAFKAIEK